MNKNHRILIVDDHLMIIEGYKTALKFGYSNYSDSELKVDYAIDFKGAINKINSISEEGFYDLIVLDLSLPKCNETKMTCGEDLGKWIRSTSPLSKLLILTSFEDSYRINNVLNILNPEGFLLKGETSSSDFILAVKQILDDDDLFYGKKITKFLRNKLNFKIDSIDIQILNEISNGTKNINLSNYIPMSKSGIEKRKRLLKQHFKINGDSNRELILAAKNKGYI